MEKYGLVHHHSLPFGNCGWISVGLALGWSPDLVAHLYAAFLQKSIEAILGWLFPEHGNHRTEVSIERKLERGAWMGITRIIDLYPCPY